MMELIEHQHEPFMTHDIFGIISLLQYNFNSTGILFQRTLEKYQH